MGGEANGVKVEDSFALHDGNEKNGGFCEHFVMMAVSDAHTQAVIVNFKYTGMQHRTCRVPMFNQCCLKALAV